MSPGLLALLLGAPLLGDRDMAAIVDLEGRVVFEHGDVRTRSIAPGSVMKLFTAYALIEAGRDESVYACRGVHRDELGQERTCWLRAGHGPMKLRTAIAESCNVWFYENAQHLDDQRLLAIYRSFGFGKSGDLIPGSIPARDLPDLAVGDHLSFRATPWTLLSATIAIATRGRDTDLDPRALDLIAEGMREAAQGGTLSKVFAHLDVAAKTGTAKKEGTRKTRALVIGFYPASKPRYAFVVVKDEGRGAIDAGPIAAELIRTSTAR